MSSTYDTDRVESYMRGIRDFVLAWIGDAPKNVVEIGSGTGEYSLAMAAQGHRVLGMDVSPKMVELGNMKVQERSLQSCSFVLADGQEEIPAPWPVEKIMALDSWECFPRPGDLLKVAKSTLEGHGKMLIVTPNNWLFPLFWVAETLRIKKNRPAFEYHNSYPHRLKKLARQAGLTVDSIQFLYYGTTLGITLSVYDDHA